MNIVVTLKKVLQELINLQHNLKTNIIAVYLFGSFAKGTGKSKSDIDLAFVFHEKFYKEDPFMALQVAEIFGFEITKKIPKTVDVVILNGTSLSFAYFTVREGICIYEQSTTERILYEITLYNKYQDFMPFIKELRDIKRKNLIGRD
ncbi:MAG: nucleotidyltransferase domain-containing protein [Nitrospirota bacterium]